MYDNFNFKEGEYKGKMRTRNGAIDAAKGLAIIAVVLDHTYALIYSSEKIHMLTFYSVSLFIIMAGINSYGSMERRLNTEGYDWKYIIGKLKSILIPYVIATAFCTLIDGNWHFDFKNFVTHVVLFDGAAPFYFVFFFIQLILISPFLYKLVQIVCWKKKYGYLINILIFMTVLYISYIMSERTTMLELHGGAYYMLGSSYLFIYFIGIFLGVILKRKISTSKQIFFGVCSLLYLFWYFISVNNETININNYGILYDKWAINPPGIILFLYALAVWILVWVLYNNYVKFTIWLKPIELCGRYSLYIFLYHLYFIIIMRNTLFIKYPITNDNIFLRRICTIIIGIVLPIIFKILLNKIKYIMVNYYNRLVKVNNYEEK